MSLACLKSYPSSLSQSTATSTHSGLRPAQPAPVYSDGTVALFGLFHALRQSQGVAGALLSAESKLGPTLTFCLQGSLGGSRVSCGWGD